MAFNVRSNTAVACGALLLCVRMPAAQSGSATEVVPSDPGYCLYYQKLHRTWLAGGGITIDGKTVGTTAITATSLNRRSSRIT